MDAGTARGRGRKVIFSADGCIFSLKHILSSVLPDARDAPPNFLKVAMMQGKLQRLKGRFWAVFVLSFFVASCVVATPDRTPQWVKNQPSGINFSDIVLSPNGNVIAFEYTDRFEGRGPVGVGLYDWKNKKLTRIPNPAGQEIRQPSFSHDGKRLLVAIVGGPLSTQIAEINLANLHVTPLTSTPSTREYPVYQPGTDNVLYVNIQGTLSGLSLIDRSTKKERLIIDPEAGFIMIKRPSFIGKDEILFQGRGPYPIELRHKIQALVRGPRSVAYSLKFGGDLQILSEDAEREATKYFNEGAFDSLSASRGGEIITFMRVPPDNQEKNGMIVRELNKLEAGVVSQLTHLGGPMMLVAGSYNGEVAAFVVDTDGTGKDELFIYEMGPGNITPTNLLAAIRSDPAFQLK
ncbi:MAG: hypothetical protein ACK5ZH_05160 [Alphaproteobacteria bacterium]